MALSVLRVLPFLFPLFFMSAQVHAAPSLDCTNAFASPSKLWPVNHSYQKIKIKGVVHRKDRIPDIAVQCIRQDEPTNSNGDGNTQIDGKGIGDSKAWVRKERQGGGNGRVYHIGFTATDSHGASCQGIVQVGVPKTKKGTAIDDGPAYNSTNNNVDCVGIGNQAPQITSEPVTVATVNSLYSYQVVAVDHENDALTYSLANAPLGMLIEANGLISWTPEAAYVGSNTVDVEVVDAVGNTVFQTFNIEVDDPSQCDMQWSQEEYVKSKFDSIDGWALEGEATNLTPGSHNKLRLTNNTSQSATAFLTRPIQVTNTAGTANNFSTYFEVKMHNTKGFAEADGVGADGVVLVFAPKPMAPGDRGGYIGYNVFEKSVAVELDTWKNAWDKNGNHIGINAQGDSKSLKQKKISTRINDSKWAYVWVDYDAKKKQLQVRYSKSKQRPSSATLKRTMDIPALLDSDSMVVGFSSATGASGQIHDIREFKFSGVLGGADACATETLTYTTTPPEQIQAGEQIDYTAVAESTLSDATISYELITAPENVVFDPISGRVQWLSEAPGTFTFEIKATSSYGTVLVQRFELLVTEIPNTAPVAQNQNVELLENTPTAIVLTAIDAELDPLDFTVVSAPLHGDITGTAPNLSYTPFENYSGPDEITFKAYDGMVESNVAVVSITVVDVNSAPIALEQFVPIFENTSVDITLEASDADMDSLSYTVVEQPSNGVLSGTAPNLNYTPNADFVGSDEFTFTASDGALDSDIAIVEISVSNVNVAPVAQSQSVSVDEDGQQSFSLVGVDDDGDALDFIVERLPVSGQISGTAPNLVYTPNADFVGTDALSFRVSDGELESELATVTFVVTGTNDAPTLVDQNVTTNEDTAINIVLAGLDIDDDSLSYRVVTEPTQGSAELNGDTVTYTSNENYFGLDSFEVVANDGALDSDVAVIEIEVIGVNDAPIAIAAEYSLLQSTEISIELLGVDIEGAELGYEVIASTTSGELEIDGASVLYTPNPDFYGVDEFSFVVSDGDLQSEPAIILLLVSKVNSPPTITSAPVERAKVASNYSYVVEAIDAESNSLSYLLVQAPIGMEVNAESGEITWQPSSDQVGVHSVEIEVEDSDGARAVQNYIVTVLPMEPSTSYVGSEFALMFNTGLSGRPDNALIFITSEFDFSGSVFVSENEVPILFSGLANEVVTVEIEPDYSITPWYIVVPEAGWMQKYALRVKTDRPSTVYALHQSQFASDSTLVLPTDSLGSSYVLPSFNSNTGAGPLFSVIGVEDDTLVTVEATGDMLLRTDKRSGTYYNSVFTPKGESFSFVINENETIEFSGMPKYVDYTGSMVSSTKPIALFSGHKCSFVPGDSFACDHLIEQIPSTESLGDYYLTYPLKTRVGGDTFRAIAYKNATQIEINGVTVATLDKGQYFETVIDGPSVVESSNPFLLVQYSNSNKFDEHLRDTPPEHADPFMVVVPPARQYLTSYIFTTPDIAVPTHYANIIAHEYGLDDIKLNGTPVSRSLFTPISNTGYFGASIDVPQGQNEITADSPVGLTLYGYGEWESYGNIGGLALNNTQQIVTELNLEVAPQEPVALGDNVCVTAMLIDDVGNPVNHHYVDLEFSGAHVDNKRGFTGGDGKYKHCFTSLTVGVVSIDGFAGDRAAAASIVFSENTGTTNIAPAFVSAPVTEIVVGSIYEYKVEYVDANQDSVSLSVNGLPPEAIFDTSTNTITWQVSLDQDAASIGPVVIVANDGRGGLATQSFSINIAPLPNTPPKLTGLSTYGFIAGREATSYIRYEGNEQYELMFGIESHPDNLHMLSHNAGGLRWRPTIDQLGEHEVTLVASESKENGVDRKQVTVTVVESDTLPNFTSVPTLYAFVGQEYSYDADAVDPDGFSIFYEVGGLGTSYSQNPAVIDPVTGVVTWTPNRTGSFTIYVRATDLIATTVQTFKVIVKESNSAPIIVSTALKRALVSEQYSYAVLAEDDAGDVLTYSLGVAPEGMLISANGELSWTPTSVQIGSHEVEVVVQDNFNATTTQRFTLVVDEANAAPIFASSPLLSVQFANQYLYAVVVSDIDNDPLTIQLTSNIAGMLFDEVTKELTWTPTIDQIGVHLVSLQVSDGLASAIQSYEITVSDIANTAPRITSLEPTQAFVNREFTYTVEAEDDENDTLEYALISAPATASIDVDSGLVRWLPISSDIGSVSFEVSVTDGALSDTQQFTITVLADDDLPMVEIISPTSLVTLTTTTDIVGSISDANLASWQLIAQRKGTSDIIVLNEGAGEKSDELLGVFDPTMLVNGIYTIAIQAFDSAGNITLDGVTVVVDGQLKVGNFSITFNDLSIPMVGIPIEVNRTYDSRRRSEGLDFGYGWSVDYQNVDVSESRVLGRGWELREYGSILNGDIVEFCVEPLGEPLVTVRLPDGNLEEFVTQASPKCKQLVPTLDVFLEFEAKAGTTSTLKPINNRFGRLNINTGEIGVLGGDVLDPSLYELTTKAGYVYRLNQDFGIETVTDPNGHTLTYSDDGIVHSAGKRIDFVRDAEGRITEISDPSGNIVSYSYDANADLVAVTDRAFATTDFTYNNNHGLLDIIDPLGRRIVRNIYDDDGRLIAQEDNDGNRTEFNHNLDGKESIVTDRLGRATALFYDDRGNVTSRVNALGEVTNYTYDALDNQLTETNALGHTSSATWNDRYDQLTATDALGNTIAYTYNQLGNELTITDARGNVFNNTYDTVGNLLSVEDPLGGRVAQNLNAQGLPILLRDAENFDTTKEYDSEGNLTKEVSPEGIEMSYTYDDNNNRLTETLKRTVDGAEVSETTQYEYNNRDQIVKTTDPLGLVTTTEYDLAGREIASTDVKGRRTTMNYDDYGRVLTTTLPDGSTMNYSYDVEGNKLSETDELGRVMRFEYDALNRLTKTIYPDGTSSEQSYDAAGRMVTTTDQRGNVTTYTYDAADRQIEVEDEIGNKIAFAYDASGNRTSEIDARGNTTSFTYDALDRKVSTNWPDGTQSQSVFDLRGMQIETIDQNGLRTQFAYDGDLRLATVIDALNQQTQYGYDEAGNRVEQIDTNGNRTTWRFDALGRELSRTLPMGQSEQFTYDATGNVVSHTDFNGNTHSFSYHNNRDWLIEENYADGQAISYQYNAKGNRTGATDTNGSFGYTYDALDRITKESRYDGSELIYAYDAAGNKTTLTTIAASGTQNTVMYSYDALNRLAAVTEDAARLTTYSYDANSNINKIEQANGTETQHSYDALNRITQIKHLAPDTSILSQLDYILDTSGRRTRITEANGRVSEYDYDDLYRLISENITDPQNGAHDATFSYDPTGNRASRTVNGVTENYTYDNNDRLLSHGDISYGWDNNGNMISETDASTGANKSYSYDSRNKLVSVDSGLDAIALQYDMDENRVSKTVDGETTRFLVDNNQQWAQVLFEETTNGEELGYVFGHDLIGLDTGTDALTYHGDALGSTRVLSDGAGQQVDDIRYDAWGEQLSGGAVTDNKYLYTGEQFDAELGDYYLRARYMRPGVGRFTQMDEWGGLFVAPLSQNKFVYANANPTLFLDPTGNYSVGSIFSALNTAATLLTVGTTSYSATSSLVDGDFYGAGKTVAIGAISVAAILKGPDAFKALFGKCATWCTLFYKFSRAERQVIKEVKSLQAAGVFSKARGAIAAGKEISFTVAGRQIQVVPNTNFSGMTLFGYNGIVLGSKSVVSEMEFIKTLLHELYRLTFQKSVQAGAAGAAKVPTQTAQGFADKAYELFVK